MIKKFKFTIIFAIIFAVVFMYIHISPTKISQVEITAVPGNKGYTVTGQLTPFYKAYRGYEYKIENGAAILTVKSSFNPFGEKDFQFEIGSCKYIYISDGNAQKEIEIK